MYTKRNHAVRNASKREIICDVLSLGCAIPRWRKGFSMIPANLRDDVSPSLLVSEQFKRLVSIPDTEFPFRSAQPKPER